MHYQVLSHTTDFAIAEFEYYSDARAFAARWNALFSHDPHLTQERYVVRDMKTQKTEIPYLDSVSEVR